MRYVLCLHLIPTHPTFINLFLHHNPRPLGLFVCLVTVGEKEEGVINRDHSAVSPHAGRVVISDIPLVAENKASCFSFPITVLVRVN